MNQKIENMRVVPGLDVVGRGIFLKPHQPYSLRSILAEQTEWRSCYSPETNQTYRIPKGYDINESPPLPEKQALNRVVIEESFEHFDELFSLDTKVAASGAVFSIDANAGQASQVRVEGDAYYVLRASFVPLWALYLSSAPPMLLKDDCNKIPVAFDHDDREIYDEFFERFGTHFVKSAWVGGQAKLIFTILKSSELSKQEIQTGVKASFIGEGEGTSTLKEMKDRLQTNSDCTVWGKGGAENQLAALSTLDAARYNDWLQTIRSNPQTIELEVRGIWTLVEDKEKSKALRDAYEAATSFKPVSTAFIAPSLDNPNTETTYFLRGDMYFTWSENQEGTCKPKPITTLWPELTQLKESGSFSWIDAGFCEHFSLFLFSRNEYVAIDLRSRRRDPPKKVSEKWPGVDFDRIDAVFSDTLDAIYFFHGKWYVRFSISEGKVLGGKKLISERWVGVTFDRIDAVFYRADTGKAYFFRNDQHIRYDMCTYRSDPGYPKAIVGSYTQDWQP